MTTLTGLLLTREPFEGMGEFSTAPGHLKAQEIAIRLVMKVGHLV